MLNNTWEFFKKQQKVLMFEFRKKDIQEEIVCERKTNENKYVFLCLTCLFNFSRDCLQFVIQFNAIQ